MAETALIPAETRPEQADGTLSHPKPRTPPERGEYGYERRKGDAYFTQAWVTRAGLKLIVPRGIVWEPACGMGHMTNVLEEHGHRVVSTDIARHGYDGQTDEADFLNTRSLPDPAVRTIFTNPPNRLADAFAFHAIELMRAVDGMVVMLFEHGFVAAGPTRDALFDPPMPWSAWIVITRRPRWIEEAPAVLEPVTKKKKKGPRRNYAFCVWDWRHRGPPVIARVR